MVLRLPTMNTSSKFSAINLIEAIRTSFTNIPDKNNTIISLPDCLMSALAIFGLKYPSLLKFDKDRVDEVISHNLKVL